jgi:protein-S-isoprenylcysteine O-methyltransferase Ste14
MKLLALTDHFPSVAPALRSLGAGAWPKAVQPNPAFAEASAGKAVTRDWADVAGKFLIVTLFSSMAVRLAQDAAKTGHVTGMLLLASEALVVVLTMVRRPAGSVDRTMKARLLTATATFGAPLVTPMSGAAIAPEPLTIAVAAIGLIIVVLGKMSLGRSFGLCPANRGVVSTGMYRFMRHPIYFGYLITHVGFIAANPGKWNLFVLVVADVALLFRAVCEEETLARDESYRTYMGRVRWRIVPGVF